MLKSILLFCTFACLIACNHIENKPTERAEAFDPMQEEVILSDDRSNWQKPNFVIEHLGDLSQKTIADIGSGPLGYFTFELMRYKDIKKVIALDIDPEAITMLSALKNALDEERRSKLEVRQTAPDIANLNPLEIDGALIVNTMGYIADPLAYLTALKTRLKPGGKVVIVDFKIKRLPEYVNAPAYENRSYLHVTEEALYDAGYQNINTDDTSLKYQYLIVAENSK